MKKIYMTPAVEELECLTEEMIAISGVGSEEPAIEYGGVDTEGTLDPSGRGFVFPFE